MCLARYLKKRHQFVIIFSSSLSIFFVFLSFSLSLSPPVFLVRSLLHSSKLINSLASLLLLLLLFFFLLDRSSKSVHFFHRRNAYDSSIKFFSRRTIVRLLSLRLSLPRSPPLHQSLFQSFTGIEKRRERRRKLT